MKVGLISLGCPKNLVDSEVMLGLTAHAGHELTSDPAGADVLVVNTCAFIDSAKQESIDTILEMAQHKTSGSCRRLIVTGCLAERYRAELKAQIPEIDAVLGTGEVPDIVRAIDGGAVPLTFHRPGSSFTKPVPSETLILRQAQDERSVEGLRTSGNQIDTLAAAACPAPVEGSKGEPPTYIYDAETPRLLATPKHYAYIKIAEGCDYKCAFCIIPTLRGGYRSRLPESIVREARALAARGVKELLLVSQDTTFYGVDRGERGALARLLRELNTIDGLEWIRLLYLYPTTIDDATLAAMAECEKVCKYIDLPLQHASNPVLQRMKRPGTRGTYDRLLARIRDRVPGVALRTTFIVGFPGETEADVDELCAFVSDHAFDHVGVFTYSHEEGTSAHRLADDVPAKTKAARRGRVMGLQKKLVRRRLRRRIGQRARIIVDGHTHLRPCSSGTEVPLVLQGRLASQAPDIDAAVFLTDCDPSSYRTGEFADVEVVGTRGYDLVARPI